MFHGSLAESSAASGKPPSWQHAPKLLSERKTPLSASQAEILLEGGEAAMRKASEWGTPGTLGQGSVVSAIATTAAEASASERAQVSALASTRSELAAAEGELSVIRELIKLGADVNLRDNVRPRSSLRRLVSLRRIVD